MEVSAAWRTLGPPQLQLSGSSSGGGEGYETPRSAKISGQPANISHMCTPEEVARLGTKTAKA